MEKNILEILDTIGLGFFYIYIYLFILLLSDSPVQSHTGILFASAIALCDLIR